MNSFRELLCFLVCLNALGSTLGIAQDIHCLCRKEYIGDAANGQWYYDVTYHIFKTGEDCSTYTPYTFIYPDTAGKPTPEYCDYCGNCGSGYSSTPCDSLGGLENKSAPPQAENNKRTYLTRQNVQSDSKIADEFIVRVQAPGKIRWFRLLVFKLKNSDLVIARSGYEILDPTDTNTPIGAREREMLTRMIRYDQIGYRHFLSLKTQTVPMRSGNITATHIYVGPDKYNVLSL